jgi:DNA-binding CsgD family transcriptional regulator
VSNKELPSAASRRKDFGLDPLERQLIALTVAGYTNEESTQSLNISEQALRQHIENIYDKLRVSNHLELVLFAIYHHIIDAAQMPRPD